MFKKERKPRKEWTDVEDNLLKTNAHKGVRALINEGLLTDRCEQSIRKRAKMLQIDVKVHMPKHWTEEELTLLVDNYHLKGLKGVQAMGLNKSEKAIRSKVTLLGLSNYIDTVIWDDSMLKILFKYYPTEGARGVKMRHINATTDEILGKAIKLGLGVKLGVKISN